MSSAAAKSPKPIRRAVGAELVPVERFEAWHAQASAVPGLDATELALLSAIAGYHLQLQERGAAVPLSFLRLAEANRTEPIYVSTAVRNLVSLGLIGVLPGRGNCANKYLLALPRKVIASMSAAADEDLPPF
jgi:hypothetical protein